MSISENNKDSIFKYFSIESLDSRESPKKTEMQKSESHKSQRLQNPQKETKQLPTNLANRKLGEEFFKNFGKPQTPGFEEFYYHRYDEEKDVDAFKNNDGEIVYDPYVVMKN